MFTNNQTTTTKQKSKHKILARAGNRTRGLSHPSRMRYLRTNETLNISIGVRLLKELEHRTLG